MSAVVESVHDHNVLLWRTAGSRQQSRLSDVNDALEFGGIGLGALKEVSREDFRARLLPELFAGTVYSS